MLRANVWSGKGPRWGRPQLPLNASREGWVYFAQSVTGGPVKIGSTRGVALRLKTLARTAGPLRLLAVQQGGKHLELEYHFVLDPWRVHGEWFDPEAPALAELLAKVAAPLTSARDSGRGAA